MASFSGAAQEFSPDGKPGQPSSCRLEFDDESLTLIPGAGAPLSIDLGDIDEFLPQDYELHLKLYTGERIHLTRFGKSYQDLCHDLLEAYRKRLVQCLLLSDLEEISRFDGSAELRSSEASFSAPAELRLYESNLAVLPQGKIGFQWRLADIDAVDFDDSCYAVLLRSADAQLSLTRLAKRTREFMDKLQAARSEVVRKSATTVRSVFPFLSPEQFRLVADLLQEGRVAPLAQLAAIHTKTSQALVETVVSAKLKPYYDSLAARTTADGPFAGFKLIRKETEPRPDHEKDDAVGDAASDFPSDAMREAVPAPAADDSGDTEVLHWFLFPIRMPDQAGTPPVAAWEATSRSGRATYFFRLFNAQEAATIADPAKAASAIDKAIRRLNRGLLLLNFRREPIYLPDDSLALQPRYRRYAIACRNTPTLRFLRSAFLGRALHTSPDSWQQQVERILASRF